MYVHCMCSITPVYGVVRYAIGNRLASSTGGRGAAGGLANTMGQRFGEPPCQQVSSTQTAARATSSNAGVPDVAQQIQVDSGS